MKRTITVSGTGEARRPADLATVTLGIEATAASVAAAVAAAAEAMARLLEALKSAGVDASDLQTARVSTQPQHEYPPNQPPRLTGYIAQNSVRLTIRDIERAGSIIDAGISAAGDAGRLNGIAFGLSRPAELAEEARTAAVGNAYANARTLAVAAGVTLGKVLRIQEVGSESPQPRMLAMRMQAESARDTPIEAGETAVSVSVSVRYAIK